MSEAERLQDAPFRRPRDDDGRVRWFLDHILPHEPGLRAWLARRKSTGPDIDDIIQESYAILAERECVDDIANPRAYLFQVAQSLVVRNIRRSRIVSILAVEDLGSVMELVDAAATPEQAAIGQDELRRIADVIDAMPAQARQAFILRRVRGLPQREIAERMGLSENTVEKHVARGIRWLGEWFAGGGNAPSGGSRKGKDETRRAYGTARDGSGD